MFFENVINDGGMVMESTNLPTGYNWQDVKDDFFKDETLSDGIYQGRTERYFLTRTRNNHLCLTIPVQINHVGRNYLATYMTKFQFNNYYFRALMDKFSIELDLNQEPDLSKLCQVDVEVEVVNSGPYLNVKSITPIIIEESSINSSESDFDDELDLDDELDIEVKFELDKTDFKSRLAKIEQRRRRTGSGIPRRIFTKSQA